MNKDQNWRILFGGPENKRAKDQELIIRFFAMYCLGDTYYKPLAKFLNDASDGLNKDSTDKLEDLARIFRNATHLANESLNGRAFRPSRALNAAVFDSVLPAIALRQEHGGEPPQLEAVADAYDQLMLDADFMGACTRATSDEDTVATRRKLAIAAFANV